MAIFNNALAGAAGQSGGAAAAGYEIERGLRFDEASSAYLSRTFGTGGNKRTWTFSCWLKVCSPGSTYHHIFNQSNTYLSIDSNGAIEVNLRSGSSNYFNYANGHLRDYGAWCHLVWVLDTTQNLHKIYINGEDRGWSTTSLPPQNTELLINTANAVHMIGKSTNIDRFFDGYMAEVHFIDGQALTADSFGEVDADTGVWNPIAYSGTYGTTGFYLPLTNPTDLGNDAAGSNNWTAIGFQTNNDSGQDSVFDSPTNGSQTDTGAGGEVSGNYCTLNPLNTTGGNSGTSSAVIFNGNLEAKNPSSNGWNVSAGTMAVQTGKWYFEYVPVGTITNFLGGICDPREINYNDGVGNTSRSYGYYNNGTTRSGNNPANSSYSSYSAGSTIGVAFDLDNKKVYFRNNGTWQGSSDPVAGTNPAYTIQDPVANNFFYTIAVSTYDADSTAVVNTGNRPFAHAAPTGYKCLCSANLTPAIEVSSTAMDVALYTGNGGTPQTISGLNFEADLLWFANRTTGGYINPLIDQVRGLNKYLRTSTTAPEGTNANFVTATSSTGFTVGSSSQVNGTSQAMVAWTWDGGTAFSNSAGTNGATIASSGVANASAGFSIVSWTGTGANGAIVGHGLDVSPAMVIVKNRTDSLGEWAVYHQSLAAGNLIWLNENFAAAAISSRERGGVSSVSSATLTCTQGTVSIENVNATNDNYIAYCWAPVEGYSAFGYFDGNSSTDGPFIYTGFKPRWILRKKINGNSDWGIIDTERKDYNLNELILQPNLGSLEVTSTTKWAVDVLSNGFKIRAADSATNFTGAQYLWAAFAENPFKYARAV